MNKLIFPVVSALFSLMIVGCSSPEGDATGQDAAGDQTSAAPAEAPAAPAAAEQTAAADPMAGHDMGGAAPADAAQAAPTSQGKVLNVTHAAGYTYLEVDTGGRTTWLATSPVNAQTGQTVAWGDGAVMHNFTSKSLRRTFDEIVFVSAVNIVQ